MGDTYLYLSTFARSIWVGRVLTGLVHTLRCTSGHVSDIAEANTLLHGQETVAFGDAGYQGVEKRPDAKAGVTWHVAMRPGKRKALDKENNEADALLDQAEAQGQHSRQG